MSFVRPRGIVSCCLQAMKAMKAMKAGVVGAMYFVQGCHFKSPKPGKHQRLSPSAIA